MRRVPALVIAASFALSSFAVAIIAGLSARNATSVILLRAITVLVVCYPVGVLVGYVCQRVIERHVQSSEADEAAEPTEGAAPDAALEVASAPSIEEEEVIEV